MLIEISVGDLVDKMSILDLKQKYIKDPIKLEEVKKELTNMSPHNHYIQSQPFFYHLLYNVNDKIWNLTEEIKRFDMSRVIFVDDGYSDYSELKRFAKISNDIFEYNQKRFRMKRIFDLLFSSDIKEQKSYSNTFCNIIVKDEETVMDKLAEINYLMLEYDYVLFDASLPCIERVQTIFKSPTVIDLDKMNRMQGKITKEISLSEFCIEIDVRKMCEFLPIKYIASGTLGDFIHQLSIINENFYKTGSKGILFLTDMYNMFNWGPVETFKDTYEIISKQRYIKAYALFSRQRHTLQQPSFNEDNIDINLCDWRVDPYYFNANPWSVTFNKYYKIEWAEHPWLTVPLDSKWENCILINTIDYRGTIQNIDFVELVKKYGEKYKILFICNAEKHYNHFVQTYTKDVPICLLNNFTDICIAIRSCKLFIGALSSFLTIAHACHIPHLIGLNESQEDRIRVNNMDEIIPSAKFNLDDFTIMLQ